VKFRKPVRGIADSALKILASYWWPGNIRELENLIERLVAVSDKEWVTDEDLPLEYHFAKLDSGPSTGEALFQEACDTFERNFILRAREAGLERHGARTLPWDPAQHAGSTRWRASISATRAQAARRLGHRFTLFVSAGAFPVSLGGNSLANQ
jgi:transcriptional regulator with AAA-type ATPase domain